MRNLIADLCRATTKLKPSQAAAVPRHSSISADLCLLKAAI
jgi:hypothetical protein